MSKNNGNGYAHKAAVLHVEGVGFVIVSGKKQNYHVLALNMHTNEYEWVPLSRCSARQLNNLPDYCPALIEESRITLVKLLNSLKKIDQFGGSAKGQIPPPVFNSPAQRNRLTLQAHQD